VTGRFVSLTAVWADCHQTPIRYAAWAELDNISFPDGYRVELIERTGR
jgi:hypothetical protein